MNILEHHLFELSDFRQQVANIISRKGGTSRHWILCVGETWRENRINKHVRKEAMSWYSCLLLKWYTIQLSTLFSCSLTFNAFRRYIISSFIQLFNNVLRFSFLLLLTSMLSLQLECLLYSSILLYIIIHSLFFVQMESCIQSNRFQDTLISNESIKHVYSHQKKYSFFHSHT